uniref:G-protein coupled receptors family 1 profile domain-containing protein n=1 Tax=Monopterus albus TaxID=43700 RepID=A0A3Q3K4I4_MONAL
SGNNTSSSSIPAAVTHHNFPALIFGILLIVIITGGNVLVCLSVYLEKALKTTTNYFIVSLAFADLMLAVLVLPLFVYAEFQGGVWSLNMLMCDGLMTMDVMLCTASIFNLCAISVDRFIAVSIPLNYNRKHVDHRQLILLSATWLLALAVASPVIFGINNVPNRDPSECKLEDHNYVVYSSICSFFIPCPIMVLLYFGVFRGLQRWEEARKAKLRSSIEACRKLQHATVATALPPLTENSVPTVTFSQQQEMKKRAKITSRERKAMKVLPVVVGCFLFCWTPFFVVHTMRAMCLTCNIPPGLMSTVTWLGYVNSALNPIIYTIFNAEFKKFFKKCFRSCC